MIRNKWGLPQLTLDVYLKFWSLVCYLVTLWLLFFKKEDKEVVTEADMSITGVYKTIWDICKLKRTHLPPTSPLPLFLLSLLLLPP